MSEQLILDALKRIEDKVDQNIEVTNANSLVIAVLGERVGNVVEKANAAHEKAQDAHDRAHKIEKEHGILAAKITTVAAAIAFAFTTVLGFVKDVVAATFSGSN